MRRSRAIAGVAVLGVVAAAVYYFGFRGTGEQAPAFQTTQVRTGTVREVVSGTGTLEAKKTYPVLVQGQGVVDRLDVSVGDTIKLGRRLFSVGGKAVYATSGGTPLYRQLASGDSGTDVRSLQWSLRRLGYDVTVDGDYGDDTIDGLHEFQDDRGLEEADTAGPDTFQALPLPLRVMDVGIEQGQSVSRGTVAMTLANPKSLEVVIDVNEIDMPKIKLGESVSIKVDALPGRRFTGKVTAVSPGLVASSSSQTQADGQSSSSSQTGVVNYPVTISLRQRDSRLKAGMQASADIVIRARKNVLSIPSGAVHDRDGQKYVTVVGRGGVRRVPVKVGLSSDTAVEIRSGLQEGDIVVVGAAASSSGASDGQGGSSSSTSSSGQQRSRSPGMGGMFGGGRRD